MAPVSFVATLRHSDLGMVGQSRRSGVWVGLEAAITTQCRSWPCQVQEMRYHSPAVPTEVVGSPPVRHHSGLPFGGPQWVRTGRQ